MAFLKNILAKLEATIPFMPQPFSAMGACSLEEPQPKFSPATTKSPAFTFFGNSGHVSSRQWMARDLGSEVTRYFPAIMWSVLMLF